MRTLVIDDRFKAQLEALIKYAQKYRITPEEMIGNNIAAGDNPRRVVETDFGFRIVFSIEGHPQKSGETAWLRHMSISVDAIDKLPNAVAVQEIGTILGFPSLDECQVYIENYPVNDGELTITGKAINVIALIGYSTVKSKLNKSHENDSPKT